MSVTALPARTGRRTSHPAGPGRSSGTGRRAAPSAVPSAATPAAAPPAATPSLTVTLAIPLSGDGLSPEAHRLIDVLRDLIERGNGTVTVAAAPGAGVALPPPRPPETLAAEPPETLAAETAEPVAVPSEVRLLAGSRQV